MSKFCPSCGVRLHDLPCPKCEPKDLDNSTIERVLDPDAQKLENKERKEVPEKEGL